MFKNIKENMNMKIEVVFGWKCVVLIVYIRKREISN